MIDAETVTEGVGRVQLLAYVLIGAGVAGFTFGAAYALFAKPTVQPAQPSTVRQVTPPRGEMACL